MSAHLTAAQGLAVGVTTGAVAAGAIAEWFLTRLRDQLDMARDTIAGQDRKMIDLSEELEDTIAERDAFRWHLDQAISEDDARARAMAYHPAGGRRTSFDETRPALRIVGRA